MAKKWAINMMKICVMMLISGMNGVLAMEPATSVVPQGIIKLAGTDPETGVQGKIEEVPSDVAWKIGVVKNPLKDLSKDITGQIILPQEVIQLSIEPEKLEKIIDILKIQKPEELAQKIKTLDMAMLVKVTNGANKIDLKEDILIALRDAIISKINDTKAYLLGSTEKVDQDFFNKYVNASLMPPLINQLKMEILKKSSHGRRKLLCKARDCIVAGVPSVLKFMNNDEWIIVGGQRPLEEGNGGVGIYEIASKTRIAKLDYDPFASNVNTVAIHERSAKKYIAIGNSGTKAFSLVKVDEIENPKTCTVKFDKGFIVDLAFNQAGTLLASLHQDNSARGKNSLILWDVTKIDWQNDNPVLNEDDRVLLPLEDRLDTVKRLLIEDKICYVIGSKNDDILLLTFDISSFTNPLYKDQHFITQMGKLVNAIHDIALSPDGKKIAVCKVVNSSTTEKKLIIYDRDGHKVEHQIDFSFRTLEPKISFTDDYLVWVYTPRVPHEPGLAQQVSLDSLIIDTFSEKTLDLGGMKNLCCNASGTKIVFFGTKISVTPIPSTGMVDSIFGQEKALIEEISGIFIMDMFDNQEINTFEKMKKVTLQQALLIRTILSSENKLIALNDNEKEEWKNLPTAMKDTLKKYYAAATANLSREFSYEEKYLPVVEEAGQHTTAEQYPEKAGQFPLWRKKPWWQKKFEELKKRAQDAARWLYQSVVQSKSPEKK